ncbi:hypothetical protein [Melittangium boletus]|uniref:Carboxypeptidase regulatory-like domain-containing protein n=1 Tax=Melittangium boletus DSM 14713 TaxID=1294270 RepID=A0A250ILQ4_9BACT|nr:hypothetical protein [Melittangium boletus]ATB32685.1 hypothetical protein MEBOL_006174 [Melittangium boletus DSM 14713]
MKRSVLVWSCCASLLFSACGGQEGGDTGTPDGGGNLPSDGGGNEPNPSTITVTGKVLAASGAAATKVSILIPGDGRREVSVDGAGAFSVSGVTPPYDLIVAEKERRSAILYRGLTLKTLTLSLEEEDTESVTHRATVKGNLTGEDASPSSTTEVSFVSERGSGNGLRDIGGSYSLDVDWLGATPVTGTLYAFQYESSSSYSPPTRYLGFGQRDNVTLEENATLSAQDIALSAVTNSNLGGSITVPDGYALRLSSVSLAPTPATEVSLFSSFAPTSTFNYVVPQIPQATFSMQVFASEEGASDPDNAASLLLFKRGLTAGVTNAAMVLHPAARPAQPANEAKDVSLTTGFSWSPYASGVHRIQFQEDKSDNQTPYTVTILTRGTDTTLPDLSALGMALPANTEFTWQVHGVGPVDSVDALVGLLEKGDPARGGTEDFHTSLSETRTFTTAATP